MMKKDYEMIAGILRSRVVDPPATPEALAEVTSIARHFADRLAAGSPRFDRQRFLTACGVQS